MISFIVPFLTIEKDKFLNINEGFELTNSENIIYSTLKTIKNINSLGCEKEILLIDNSHTFPDLELPNVKVIKGWQALPLEKLKKIPEFMSHSDIKLSFDNFGADTMWASMAYHLGIQKSKGDYIVLQHNDVFYHNDFIQELVSKLEREKLGYISVDNKKVWISTYLLKRRLLDNHITNTTFSPQDGGHVNTKFGFADAYFFLTRKSFFDNYNVDWSYGDTNHGATVKCLHDKVDYLHLGPYWDNPNFDTPKNALHTYSYNDKPFISHLKGGFSEQKMSSTDFEYELDRYFTGLNDAN